MLVYGTNEGELRAALANVNKHFADNVIFKRLDFKSRSKGGGETWWCSLTVKASRPSPDYTKQKHFAGMKIALPGARISIDGHRRRIAAACWHVHGVFLDSLPRGLVVRSGDSWQRTGGAWIDRNIGSQVFPMMYSDACDCALYEEEAELAAKYGYLKYEK